MCWLTLSEIPVHNGLKAAGQESKAEPKHSPPVLKGKERKKGRDYSPQIPPKATTMVI